MTTAQAKLKLLGEVVDDEAALNLVLDKLLAVIREEHRFRLERYEAALTDFETRYHMSSSDFYQRFEEGELGDAMDFFEWTGLFELKQDLLRKILRLQ